MDRKCDYCKGTTFHEHRMTYATMELEVTDPDYHSEELVGLVCDVCYEVQCLRELTEDEQKQTLKPRGPKGPVT